MNSIRSFIRITFASLGLLAILISGPSCANLNKKSDTPPKESTEDTYNPKLRKPIVRKIWVADEIQGNEYIRGHWKFVLEEPPVWGKEADQ
jgi:hypothetical protein